MDSLKIKFFLLSFKQKLLCAHTENTLNGEINTESVYISVNNNTNFKKIYILSIYTIWDRLSLKTISRYCPFKSIAPLILSLGSQRLPSFFIRHSLKGAQA